MQTSMRRPAAPSRADFMRSRLTPMPARVSVLLGVLVALLGWVCFYGLRPFLEEAGYQPYAAYLLSLSAALAVMLASALLAYTAEGQPWTREAFLRRCRLEWPGWRVIALSVGLGLGMLLTTVLFSPVLAKAVAVSLLRLPAGIPDYVNPVKQLSPGLLKDQLAAQGVLPLIPIVLLLNILAEELFWRGMVFPRQELRHAKAAYLVHGVIWALTHAFQYWLLPPILVGSLALAYVVQRTRSTWVGVVAHLVNNALPFLILLFVPAQAGQ